MALLIALFLPQTEDSDTVLDNLHSFLKPSSVSSPYHSTTHDRDTTADFLNTEHTNEAREGMRRAIRVDENMLSIACQWFYCETSASKWQM
jgi:hypothetical protein